MQKMQKLQMALEAEQKWYSGVDMTLIMYHGLSINDTAPFDWSKLRHKTPYDAVSEWESAGGNKNPSF